MIDEEETKIRKKPLEAFCGVFAVANVFLENIQILLLLDLQSFFLFLFDKINYATTGIIHLSANVHHNQSEKCITYYLFISFLICTNVFYQFSQRFEVLFLHQVKFSYKVVKMFEKRVNVWLGIDLPNPLKMVDVGMDEHAEHSGQDFLADFFVVLGELHVH